MRRPVVLVLGIVLASCGKSDPPKPATPASTPAVPAAPVPEVPPALPTNPPAPTDPPPPDSPDWKGTAISIPVAERSLNEHLDLLEAQSSFRVPNGPAFRRYDIDVEVRFVWGKKGTFWEVFLDLCERAGLTFYDVPTYLQHGRHRVKGLQAIGPALVGMAQTRLSRGTNLDFRIWTAFEPFAEPDSLKYPRVQIGSIQPTPGFGSGNTWSCFAWGIPPGPVDVWFEIPRVATFAHLELEPVAGATASIPGGEGKVSVVSVDGATITTREHALDVRGRWLMRGDESKVEPSDYHVEGTGPDRDWRVIFPEAFLKDSVYVLKSVTGFETKRFHAHWEQPDWAAWARDEYPLRGLIRWERPPAGATDVSVLLVRTGPDPAGDPQQVVFHCEPSRVRQGGEDAASQRGSATSGPLTLGLANSEPFLSYRAEGLPEGSYIILARAGACVAANGFTIRTNYFFPDIDFVLEPSADLSGTAPAGAPLRLVPCDSDGKPRPVPAGTLGPLETIVAGADGLFEVKGLQPGQYQLESGGKTVPLTLRRGANSARFE